MSALDFILELTSLKLGAHVRINGFGVFSSTSPRPTAFATHADGFLVDGDNRVEVFLERVAEPEDLEGDPVLEMRMFSMPRGEAPTEQDLWLGVGWAKDTVALPPAGASATRVLDHAFVLPKAAAAWRWASARPVDAPVVAAQKVLAELGAALGTRNYKLLREMFALRSTELSLGADAPRQAAEDHLLLPIADLMSEPDFDVHIASAAELVAEPAFGGRVVHVRTRAERAPISVRAGLTEVSIPLSIADIDGRPTIVR